VKPLAKGAGGAALAVGVALTAATWAHALSGFGGAATDDLFARWVYDAIIVSAAFTLLWLALTRTESRVPWAALGVSRSTTASRSQRSQEPCWTSRTS
jgi:hypothetical protein